MTAGRSNRVFAYCGLLLVVAACASARRAPGDPYRWVPGVYQIEGELRYRSDTPDRERTERLRILGDVTIGQEGPISFEVPLGVCLEPEPTQDRVIERRNGWDLRCGEAGFTLWPEQNRIRGRVSMMVTELRRVGACVQYTTDANGQRSCVRYAYSLQSDRVTRTGSVVSTLKR